jgi:hypothetical protein
LEGSPEGTSGGISYIFLLFSTALLEQLRELYTSEPFLSTAVTDTLSTMLRLLGEELEAASWLIKARSRMEPVELCDEEW